MELTLRLKPTKVEVSEFLQTAEWETLADIPENVEYHSIRDEEALWYKTHDSMVDILINIKQRRLFYRIKSEPTFRAYDISEINEIYGQDFVSKDGNRQFKVNDIYKDSDYPIRVSDEGFTLQDLFDNYTKLDGTPAGKEVV